MGAAEAADAARRAAICAAAPHSARPPPPPLPSPHARRGRRAAADALGRLPRRAAGGEPTATDPSHALKTGYDALRQRWPVELLEALGVPGAILPPVVAAGTPIGSVCAAASAATGLPQGAAIVAGMTRRLRRPDRRRRARPRPGRLGAGHDAGAEGRQRRAAEGSARSRRQPPLAGRRPKHPGGASNVGAGILAARFPGRDLAALDAAAAAREPAGQLVYPLTARGERFPSTTRRRRRSRSAPRATRPTPSPRCCRASPSSSGSASPRWPPSAHRSTGRSR